MKKNYFMPFLLLAIFFSKNFVAQTFAACEPGNECDSCSWSWTGSCWTWSAWGCGEYIYCPIDCVCGANPPDSSICEGADVCSGDCFTPDTPVKTPEGEEAIIDLTEGDEVVSFDPETGSPSTGIIQKTFRFTRDAYYKIRTKDGRELKVTGTHPLFAVQKSETPLSFIEYLKTESIINRLISNILH